MREAGAAPSVLAAALCETAEANDLVALEDNPPERSAFEADGKELVNAEFVNAEFVNVGTAWALAN